MEIFKFHYYKDDNYPIFEKFINYLLKPDIFKSSMIVQLGINNDKSTFVFDGIANKYDCDFILSDNSIEKTSLIINELGTKTQIITEDTINFIYNLSTYIHISKDPNFKNLKIHLYLNCWDNNLFDIENINIYYNSYLIIKSQLKTGSQILIYTNKNFDLISIMKKELNDLSLIFENDLYLLFII